MQPSRFRANFFRHRRSKGNHIMPYLGFNFLNTLQVKVTAFGNGAGGVFRDKSGVSQGKAGGSFNLEPATKFIFITPDSAHLRAGIAWNQRFFLSKAQPNVCRTLDDKCCRPLWLTDLW